MFVTYIIRLTNFVSVCFLKATEDLRVRVGNLKNMYGSGIDALDNLAKELKGNNQLIFEDLNSEVAKHSSALEDVSICYPFIN